MTNRHRASRNSEKSLTSRHRSVKIPYSCMLATSRPQNRQTYVLVTLRPENRQTYMLATSRPPNRLAANAFLWEASASFLGSTRGAGYRQGKEDGEVSVCVSSSANDLFMDDNGVITSWKITGSSWSNDFHTELSAMEACKQGHDL